MSASGPLEIGDNPATWLVDAARDGLPAAIPVLFDGRPGVASGVASGVAVITGEDTTPGERALRAFAHDPRSRRRALAAIVTCHHMRRWALDQGARPL